MNNKNVENVEMVTFLIRNSFCIINKSTIYLLSAFKFLIIIHEMLLLINFSQQLKRKKNLYLPLIITIITKMINSQLK